MPSEDKKIEEEMKTPEVSGELQMVVEKINTAESVLVTLSKEEIDGKVKSGFDEFLSDWESQGVEIIRADYSSDIRQKKCYVTGTITACGNFISYQEILEEEWRNQDEYSGNNP